MKRALLLALSISACTESTLDLPTDGGVELDAAAAKPIDCRPHNCASAREQLIGPGREPALIWNGAVLALAWQQDGALRFATISPEGETSEPITLAEQGSRPSIVWNGSEHVVFFNARYRATEHDIFAASVAANGEVSRSEDPVRRPRENPPNTFWGADVRAGVSAAWTGSEYALAWMETEALGSAFGGRQVRLAYGATLEPGSIRGVAIADHQGASRSVSMIQSGDRLFGVVWREELDRRLNRAVFAEVSDPRPGRVWTNKLELGTYLDSTTAGPAVAASDQGYGIAWQRESDQRTELVFSRAMRGATALESELSIGSGWDPALAGAADHYALAWIGDSAADGDELYFARIAASGESEMIGDPACLTTPSGFRNLADPRIARTDSGWAIAFADSRRTGFDPRDGDAGEEIYVLAIECD